MKKFIKFSLAVVSAAVVIGGVFYFIKNILMKDSWDDLDDDFDDDFDDEFDDEMDDESVKKDDTREYVKLNVNETDETQPQD